MADMVVDEIEEVTEEDTVTKGVTVVQTGNHASNIVGILSGSKHTLEEEGGAPHVPANVFPVVASEDRFKSVLKMMSNPKKTRESLSASVTVSSSSGTTAKLIIISYKINEKSAEAPVQVEGVLVDAVSIPHVPYKLEPLFPDFAKRESEHLPAGSMVAVSVFMKDGSKRAQLAPLKPLLLNGVSWNMNVAFKRQEIKGIETLGEEGGNSGGEGGSAAGKVVLWETGDMYMCYTAKEGAFIPMSEDAISEALGRCYIGETAGFPNYNILAYPEEATTQERVRICVKPSKNKAEEELFVVHPNLIPNEVLRSRQYPHHGIMFHIRNMTYLDEKFVSKGGLCQAVCTIPTDKFLEVGKAEIAFTKKGEEKPYLAIRGKDKKNTQTIWLPDGTVGVCQSAFYQEEVNKLGVFSFDIAKNCLPGLVTYLDAVVYIELDKSARPIKSDEFAFVHVGVAKFLKVNYLDMFSNAGLEVSVDSAYDILTSLDTKKSLNIRGVKSEHSATDDNYKQFKSNPDAPPPVLCLNAFTGEFNKELMPGAWRVFAVPPTDAYRYEEHFAEEDPLPIQDIMAEQAFGTKRDLGANYDYIKSSWGNCLKRVTFFAVKV
jgi:hypothetical protein